MTFNSIHFLLFFPLVTLGVFLLPHRLRWGWLLIASCVFYMDFIPAYIIILFVTIVIDYFAGLLIESAPPARRKLYLITSLVSNIGILAIFKYVNFLIDNLNVLSAASGVTLEHVPIILPVGLSFHTFQAMAYTLEVYYGRQKAERHFGIYALYVMFYPQLVAGPIERPQNLLPQFREYHPFDPYAVSSGLKLMAWGFFQKVVIADRLALIANPVFDAPQKFHGLPLIVAAVAFTLQIYFDFCGYSDIARGAAEVMGFRLMPNFRRPFLATSIADFWGRWHVSLSTWFRDYLYIPLGGNRVSRPRWYFNLMVVFLISGLWHGASWNFVVWGALHGTYLILGLLLAPYVPATVTDDRRLPIRTLRTLWTFGLVCLAFIFFRATTFEAAWYFVTHLHEGLLAGDTVSTFLRTQEPTDWKIVGVALALVFAVHVAQERGSVRVQLALQPAWVRWPVYVSLTYATVFMAKTDASPQFIYFQF